MSGDRGGDRGESATGPATRGAAAPDTAADTASVDRMSSAPAPTAVEGSTADTARAVGLVVAKAPVPGYAKTRLAAYVGDQTAADLAAAALLDTLDAVTTAFETVHVSLAGDLAGAARADEIAGRLQRCEVSQQQGDDFGARLSHAHRCAGDGERLVVQLGMDTPQVTAEQLREVAVLAGDDRRTAVLGPARDGGWWVLAVRDPGLASVLADVPMSRRDTGELTERALRAAGASVRGAAPLRDVDDVRDAEAVARSAPGTRFAAVWAAVPRELLSGRTGLGRDMT